MVEPWHVSAEDYMKLNAAIKELTDKKLARLLRKRLRYAAGPVGRLILERGAAKMPRRGGLAERLMRSSTSSSIRGNAMDLWLGRRNKSQISRLNKGVIRRPVWADAENKTRNEWAWVNQDVPAGAFTEAFKGLAPEIGARMQGVMDDIMKELEIR